MSHETIINDDQLLDLCSRLENQRRIGFDTEFVSEDTFRPQLCLIQVAAEGVMAVIDPLDIKDLNPFWRLLAEGDHITIVHAAREEVNFSLTAIDAPPANVFDTQLAAAFCSNEYPAAYASVVTRFLGRRIAKGEQRTDWRRRPLTDDQINYALEDVRHLFDLHDTMMEQINSHGRATWLEEETAAFLEEVISARTRSRWRKVSGAGNMSPRNLAIVRELWHWRQSEAERRDLPPRRVLRDDLIVELAKRKSTSGDKIRAVRGMQHGALKRAADDIAEAVQRGLDASLDEFKSKGRQVTPPQLNLLGQVLTPAITSVCRGENMAASLTGTASDVRDYIGHALGFSRASDEPPVLAQGWRKELVGSLIDDLLEGRKSIRIEDPKSEHPLSIDSV